MALYEHLPVYKKALELIIAIEHAVRDFPRYHKYLARSLTALIIKASQQDKLGGLTALRDQSEELKMLIVAGNSARAIERFQLKPVKAPGRGAQCGFPVRLLSSIKRRARRDRISYICCCAERFLCKRTL